jgi:hypothetical protein
MRKLLLLAALFSCTTDHHVGFGPGDIWSTVGGAPGIVSNYAGPVNVPTLRAWDGGVATPFLQGAFDGTSPVLISTSAGIDLGDSGVTGTAMAGLVRLFFDGGGIATSTSLATISLPYSFPDAGFTVDCKHAPGAEGITEGPVELGTALYCQAGGDAGTNNTFQVFMGPNPLGATGVLGAIAHDGGPGVVLVQYMIGGW